MSEDPCSEVPTRTLEKEPDRRRFLRKTAVAFGGVSMVTAFPYVSVAKKSLAYPFKLGVASGDPLPHSVVLWTRLAPEPLAGGGMPAEKMEVAWEVAEDQAFNRIVRQGTVTAGPMHGHSVHVEVEGLEPATRYYYRFKAGGEVSPMGRTKTTPARDASPTELNIAFASCQSYPAGYYTAYSHLAEEEIDLMFFLGDYIYEGGGQGKLDRGHRPQREVRTLREYRIRYGQYKSDPFLQAAHAAFPWIVAPDDHEVKNNWGGEGPPYEDNEAFLARRAAAFQAYYEHMPLRERSMPERADMQLYRGFSCGDLVQFDVLDTRQFRTDFACGGGVRDDCKERLDPQRTMLGGEQEDWLFDRLKTSSARWNVLPQQVMMAQGDRDEGPGTRYSMDKWDGYAATRSRLFEVIEQNAIENFVVLTGDSHKNWANNLLADFSDSNSPVLGAELMGTSISSGGDGNDLTEQGEKLLGENAHIKFFNAQRGYVRCTITPEEIKAEFRVLPYVSTPGAPVKTRASFSIRNGEPGLVQVGGTE